MQIRHDLVTVSGEYTAVGLKKSTSLLFSNLPLVHTGKGAVCDGQEKRFREDQVSGKVVHPGRPDQTESGSASVRDP